MGMYVMDVPIGSAQTFGGVARPSSMGGHVDSQKKNIYIYIWTRMCVCVDIYTYTQIYNSKRGISNYGSSF